MAIVLLVLGALLGAFATIFVQGMITRPRLRISGSGGGVGPNPGVRHVAITISNEPGFLNFRLGQTVILGKRLLRGRTIFSVPFERVPAYECTAVIIREGAQQGVGLWWLTPESENAISNLTTISPGKSASLRLLVKEDSDPERYFYYQPSDVKSGSAAIPLESGKIAGERNFDVTLFYSYGRQQMKFKVSVVLDPHGNLQVQMPNSSMAF